MSSIPPIGQHLIDWESYGVEEAVNRLIDYAGEIRASDLFITSHESYVAISIRHLGAVRRITELSPEFGRRLVTTVKAFSGMDISNHLRPAEGRQIHPRPNRPSIDLRVNSIPTLFGEDISIRLLDRETGMLSLEQLGLAPLEFRLIVSMLDKPSGLVLVTGPTGSGKTTTLYSCIQHLNNGKRKINTIEDPVEFVVDGVNQAQVHAKIGLDFPELLTACLRQAPDVMMIGEIRDPVTAKTAVRAANSGHLVLATLHAPVAVAAMQSMIAYGVNRTFLASSVTGVISQRLVRGLCTNCRIPVSEADAQAFAADIRPWLEPNSQPTIYRPGGCDKCLQTGYDRRVCVAEVLMMNDELREMIVHGRHSTIELHHRAVAMGMMDFGVAARLQVARGDTTPEEMFHAIPLEYSFSNGHSELPGETS